MRNNRIQADSYTQFGFFVDCTSITFTLMLNIYLFIAGDKSSTYYISFLFFVYSLYQNWLLIIAYVLSAVWYMIKQINCWKLFIKLILTLKMIDSIKNWCFSKQSALKLILGFHLVVWFHWKEQLCYR